MADRPIARALVTILGVGLAFVSGRYLATEFATVPDEIDERVSRSGGVEPVADAEGPAPSRAEAPFESASSASSSPGVPSSEELLRTASRVAALRAALAAVEPAEELWPDEPPEALRPEAFEAAVLDALEAVGGAQLLAMDCEEYPCVATLVPDLPDDAPELDGLGRMMEVRGELEERLGIAVDGHLDRDEDGARMTFGAHPEDLSGGRLGRRLEDAWNDAGR